MFSFKHRGAAARIALVTLLALGAGMAGPGFAQPAKAGSKAEVKANVTGQAVEINSATVAELDGVRGIGPNLSGRILEARQKGEFKSWQDFMDRVTGVREARAGHLSEAGLRVRGAAYTEGAKAK